MSLSGSDDSRCSSWATIRFAIWSSTAEPRKMMRSLSSREKMSYSRSPRAVRSMTIGTRGIGGTVLDSIIVTPALSLTALTKRYDDGFLAVEDFDLEVPAGAFFGLLGPNGAGKTTLISAVCNLIRVSEGDIRIFGHEHDTMEARKLIGLAEQDVNLDRFLDVEETLLYHGGYYGMSRAAATGRAGEMMAVSALRARARARAPKPSGGMRRRLLLARALRHEPRLVILDEPTAGVDVELRLELWRYIRRLHGEGTTILLTTHYLEEAEQLCEEIGLIQGGRLIARDSAQGLRDRFGVDRLHDVYVKAMEVTP